MILQKIQQHLSFYLFLKTVRESESGAAIFATTGEYSQVGNMGGLYSMMVAISTKRMRDDEELREEIMKDIRTEMS
jgi:hypothetical protein